MKNKMKKYETEEQMEVKRFVLVLLGIILIVVGIYFFTRAFVTKDLFSSNKENTEELISGTVNYDIAIMGQILNRPYDEYYVAIYDQADCDYIRDMSTLVS